MNGRRKALLGSLAVGLFALAIFRLWPVEEPVYRGYPASYWARQAALPFSSRYQARAAILTLGAKATPYLCAELRKNNSWRERTYRALWPRLPLFIRTHVPQPVQRDGLLCLWLGDPLSRITTLPQLTEMLQDRDPEVRLAALFALKKRAQKAGPALPALEQLLQDQNDEVRIVAALVTAEMTSSGADSANLVRLAPAAIPGLIDGLRGKGIRPAFVRLIRIQSVDALGRYGARAQSALADLDNLKTNPDRTSRVAAAAAVWQINHDPNALPFVFGELRAAPPSEADYDAVWLAGLKAFEEMGPPPECRPLLIELLPDIPQRHPTRNLILSRIQQILAQIELNESRKSPAL